MILRRMIHIAVAMVFLAIIIIFSNYHNDALIRIIFTIASYTYGPILGLFTFGLYTKREIALNRRWLIPFIAILAPVCCYFLSTYSKELFWGYTFGFELLIVNGILTYLGLLCISARQKEKND